MAGMRVDWPPGIAVRANPGLSICLSSVGVMMAKGCLAVESFALRQCGFGLCWGQGPEHAEHMNVAPVRGETERKRLNVGCGNDIRPGWVNLDVVDYGGNTVCDLNRYPWPFEDNTFDEVYASHILEHMGNFNAVVSEIWRVSKPGARFEVKVPFFLSTKYYSEPDHRIPFGIRSFDNYEDIRGRQLKFYEKWKLGHRTNYKSPAQFKVVRKQFHFSNFAVLRWLNFFINLEPVLYERFFATWLTPEEVWFELTVSK